MVRVHQPGLVQEAVPRDDVGRPPVHVARGRSIADRADAEDAVERLEAAQHVALLGRLVDPSDALVEVPVMPDLVAGVADGPDDVGPRLGDPARDEERRPQVDAIEHPEQARDGDLRPVALVGHDVEVVGRLGMVDEHDRLGIDVEGEHRGGADAVGPAEAGRQRFAGEQVGRGGHRATILRRCDPCPPRSTRSPRASLRGSD